MARKIKRPQTIIGIGTVICGLSYFLAEVFSGGIPMIWPFTVGQWVSLFGIALGTGLILWGLLKDETPLELVKYRYSKLYKIIPILRKMHQYLWSLAESQKILNVDISTFSKTGNKVNQVMGIKTGRLDPKKSAEELLKDTKEIMEMEKQQVLEIFNKGNYKKIMTWLSKVPN